MPQRSFIGILMPPDISEKIDQWRSEFYPHGFETVPPHITIIPPFNPEDFQKTLYTKVEQQLKSMPKFVILINSFGAFHHHSHTFFAKAEPSAELLQLHDAISQTMFNNQLMSSAYRSRDFIPHVTIGNRLNEEQLARLQYAVGEQPIYSRFEVEEMYLLVKETRRYEIKARWMLDKGQSVQYDAKAD